jgi:hypothetical protein
VDVCTNPQTNSQLDACDRHITQDEQARAAIPPILDRLRLQAGHRFVEAIKSEKRRVRRLRRLAAGERW